MTFRFPIAAPALRTALPALMAVLLVFSLPAFAQGEDALPAPSLTSLDQQISEFVNGPLYRFAPDSAARARALLAAATMAGQRQDTVARDQSAREAEQALINARRIARDFTSRYAKTLKLEKAAIEATGNPSDFSLSAPQETMSDLIRAFEHGELNRSAVLAETANKQFLEVLKKKLPVLMQQTDAALLQAARSNAKRYAPASYAAARQWLSKALAYNDGLSTEWPEHPRRGLSLATRAGELSKQIMQWRRKPESYENLVLKARENRLEVARALGIRVDDSNPAADVDQARILDTIGELRASLDKQRQKYQRQLTNQEAQYQLKLDEQAEALRNELTQQQGTQLSEMKEAFRAKLERETFETRRQQKLGAIFKKGEVEVLANVDGSLLLRLTGLQFASGRTSVDKKYFDLLKRVQSGLELYPDRKVVIEGHTDNRGEPDVNQRLSLKRAETVRDFLIAAGMDAGRLKALGYGEVRPVASNDYDRGRAMNRRIDIIIKAPK